MRFEQFPGRIEAGADAEVGGAFEDAAIGKVAGHRVDAVARTEIGAHVEVRGRKAQKAAVLVAVLDGPADGEGAGEERSEEHTSELQSLMRIQYAVLRLKKKDNRTPYS